MSDLFHYVYATILTCWNVYDSRKLLSREISIYGTANFPSAGIRAHWRSSLLFLLEKLSIQSAFLRHNEWL